LYYNSIVGSYYLTRARLLLAQLVRIAVTDELVISDHNVDIYLYIIDKQSGMANIKFENICPKKDIVSEL